MTNILTTAAVRALFTGEHPVLDPTKVTDAKGKPVSTASLFGKTGTAAKPGVVRGRVHPAFAAAAEAHVGKGATFREKVKAEATVTIVPVRVDVKGRKRNLKPREVPVSEVRRLGGAPAKGRIPASAKAKAALALGQK